MNHTLLAVLAASTLAACGGPSSSSPGPGPTGGGASPAETLWAAVLREGAVFAFDDGLDGEEASYRVTATVVDVREAAGGRAAILAWSVDGEQLDDTELPSVVRAGADGVTFFGTIEAFEGGAPGAVTFPTTAARLPNGYYVSTAGDLAGEVCFGSGPEGDDAECEDVCFGELCVHPTHGLTGGAGTWWPNLVTFRRTDLPR